MVGLLTPGHGMIQGCFVENITLERTLVGRNARIRGSFKRLNVGDDDVIDLTGETL